MTSETMEHDLDMDAVISRCVIIEKMYNRFLENLSDRKAEIYILNRSCLLEAVKNYFHDIARIKFAHNIENPDTSKIAGFSAFWLNKARPIQIASDQIEDSDLFVNDLFALSVFFQFLGVDTEFIPSGLYFDLIYQSHYRSIDPYGLSIVGSTLIEIQRLSKGEGI